jgi:hypothetical protein
VVDVTERCDDAELVAVVVAGDREAFGPLLERWRPRVLRLCRRALGPGPQAGRPAPVAHLPGGAGMLLAVWFLCAVAAVTLA